PSPSLSFAVFFSENVPGTMTSVCVHLLVAIKRHLQQRHSLFIDVKLLISYLKFMVYEFQEDINGRLQQLEKVHKANVQEKEDTITNLRNVILEHEKRVLELQSRTDGNVRHLHEWVSLNLVALFVSVHRKDIDKKVLENQFRYTLCGDNGVLESCTTDTEKELAKIKRVKHLLSVEIQVTYLL
ncbi:unnamed protein product, partial [Candidula unifasciata]